MNTCCDDLEIWIYPVHMILPGYNLAGHRDTGLGLGMNHDRHLASAIASAIDVAQLISDLLAGFLQ